MLFLAHVFSVQGILSGVEFEMQKIATVKLVMLTGVIFNVFLKMSFNVKLFITTLINHRKKFP